MNQYLAGEKNVLGNTTLLHNLRPGFSSEIIKDGEYYVFAQREEGQVRIGYVYTTWCGSQCGMRLDFSLVEIGKPLPLSRTGDSKLDLGQLKMFAFDRRNAALINDVYNRAMSWLHKMRREHKYPQLDVSEGCTIAAIKVHEGILVSLY